MLDVSSPSINTLVGVDLLSCPPGSKKVTQSSVYDLLNKKKIKMPTYDKPLILARKSPAERFTTSSLYFHSKLQKDKINDALAEFAARYSNNPSVDVNGITADVRSGKYAVTGDWVYPERYLPKVVDGGIIAGTTLGWISQAAEIIAHAQTRPDGQDKVFIVRPFTGEELTPWLCYQNIMAPRVKSEVFLPRSDPMSIPETVQQEFFSKVKEYEGDSSSYPAIILGKSGRPEVFIFRTP